MNKSISDILAQQNWDKTDLIQLLKTDKTERNLLYTKAAEVKQRTVGNIVYYRGLIEFSNICGKNCNYCGIRAQNIDVERYTLDNDDVLQAVLFAHKQGYGSVVFQAGERTGKSFVDNMEYLIRKSKEITDGHIGITLSLGEQSEQTYQRWFDAGAHRYLMRIETSNQELYRLIHPNDKNHSFEARLQALKTVKQIGYQAGTGVMIGLPMQTIEHLADDLLFFRQFDADMVGMGPYIEHEQTPLYHFRDSLLPLVERFDLSLKMVALLRMLMPDINIAATTAMQAIDARGREKALKVGANIIMPNITPTTNRKNYMLYPDKPCTDEGADDCQRCLEARITMAGDVVGYHQWGDSLHFSQRKH